MNIITASLLLSKLDNQLGYSTAFDLFVKDLLGQQAGHLCMMLDQLELRVDRAVENVSKGSISWRLIVGRTMFGHIGVLLR